MNIELSSIEPASWFVAAIAALLAASLLIAAINFLREEKRRAWKVFYEFYLKHKLFFTIRAVLVVVLLSAFADALPRAMELALWVVLGWVIIWQFPTVGLARVRFWATYVLPSKLSEDLAQVVIALFDYSVYRAFTGIAVFLSARYLVLPNYVANASFIEEILVFSIVGHFVYYIPFFGVLALWQRLPKKGLQRESEYGQIPAKVSFEMVGECATVKIEKCTQSISGFCHVWVLRDCWQETTIPFHAEPDKAFCKLAVDTARSWGTLYPIWYSTLVLEIREPEECKARVEFLPLKPGMKQRMMQFASDPPGRTRAFIVSIARLIDRL